MNSLRNLSLLSSAILVVFLLISFYYGVIAPPPLITYTTDENFIGESGVFLLFGNTPRALEWAGLPSTFIAYFIFLIQCAIELVVHRSEIHSIPDVLSLFDKSAFYYLNHREQFVVWERIVQLFLVGIITFKTLQFIIKAGHSSLTHSVKTILVFLCVTTDAIWISVPVIRPEALSGSLFLYIIIRILFTEKLSPKIATFLIGLFMLTFSQRLIFLFMSPFVVGGVLWHLSQQKIGWKTYVNYGSVVLLAFVACMPFILTDTLVVLKSFLGGIMIKMNHSKMDSYFNYGFIFTFLRNPLNIVFSIFALIGTTFFVKYYHSKLLSLLFIGNLLFFLFNSLKSAQLYITHTFPVAMMALVLIAFGVASVSELIKSKLKTVVILAFGMVLVVASIVSIYRTNVGIYYQQRNLADAINWVKTLPDNEKLALELDFDGLLPKNKACLVREFLGNESKKYRTEKLHKLFKIPLPDSTQASNLPIIAQALGLEDEKLFDTQYQIMLQYVDTDNSKRYDTDYFFNNNNMMSHCLVQGEAFKNFATGKYHYLVSKTPITGFPLIKSFAAPFGEAFWVYENKAFGISNK